MTIFTIRSFQDEDRAAITEARNRTRPAHHQNTVAEWERDDAHRASGEVSLRRVAGKPPVAYLSVTDRGTMPRRKPGVCGFGLWIAPEAWSDELAEALYGEAVAFAEARGATRLTTFLTLFDPDDPRVPFLAQRGFAEVDRIAPVLLDLTTFDRAQFTVPTLDGVRVFSYAEAGDTDENRRKIYALDTALERDIPTNDTHGDPPPFEEFAKNFGRPEFDPAALILAANEAGDWIGISQLDFQENTNIGWTFLTGVLPEYRGRGIALALKLRALDAAIVRGCRLILTENHEDNAPMRAINRKLGFVPDFADVSYSKEI